MPVLNRIADFHADMATWRQDLHQHPELAFQETRTAGVVEQRLHEFGVDEVHAGIAGTGVVGVIRGNGPGEAIGLRADMDALPIHEESGVPYSSVTPGVMHACGHDGHTAMLLGAARYLAETRNFAGTVYVIFQPAEEHGGGGRVMVRDGLFERFPMRQVFGMHNWPTFPAGTFRWRAGPVMAAVADITIDVTGRGAHGAQPNRGIDPVVVSAAIVQGLQSLVARNLDPTDTGVITIGSIQGGHTYNVIPETVRMLGTARWFSPAVGDMLDAGVRRLASSIAEGYGATAEVAFTRTYPATVNDEDAVALARDAAVAVQGDARVQHMDQPSMGGEDFSFMLNEKAGAYIMLGAGRAPGDVGVHHPKYDFNDDVLTVGASYWATLAERLLPRAEP